MISNVHSLFRTHKDKLALSLINLPTSSKLTSSDDPNAYLPALANRIADILTFLAYPLAFIGIVYSVYLMIAASGSPDALKIAKKNIGYIATGIFLLILTIVLFNFYASIFKA